MPRELSEDLRWRVVFLNTDGHSNKDISKILYISESTVYRILRIFHKYRCVINPFKGQTGRRKVFSREELNLLKHIIKMKVDWYLDELLMEMETYTHKLVSVSTLWRSLQYCGITRKKLQKMASERNELLRSAFLSNIGANYQPDQLIFVDESAKDERSLSRPYGYAPVNTRARKNVTFIRGKRYTILPALSLDGFLAVDIMEGSCNKERFCEFILSQVIPTMNPFPEKNSVIILDNAKIHHDESLIRIVEALGCHIIFLPPYSPDFNPIEIAFRTIKNWIKRNRDFVKTAIDPYYALEVACAQITPNTAASFFKESLYF